MATKDDKLRLLCLFQHWLGSNYNNLPTDSGNMTKRSRKFLKENEQAFSLFDVSVSFEQGFKEGWEKATSEAIKEIAKNYKPNER